MNNKKSQLLIFSVVFILSLLLFTYSLETRNSYKSNSGEVNILENIEFEVCKVAKISNGESLDSRFSSFELDLSTYCSNYNFSCSLWVEKKSGAPSNTSLLNYTHYTYWLNYTNNALEFEGKFNC